jgi:hypothetical protein
VQSPRSHQWGFRDEMVQCDESGQWLLPLEIAQCCISDKRVDAALLQPYGAHGGRALACLLGTCHVTGTRLPLTDLVECEVTGNRVSRAETATCIETGRRAVRSSLLQCDFPAGFIVNDPQAIFRSSKSGRVGSRKYLRRCYWSAQILLPDEVRQCRHTNLVFDVDLIEDDSLRLLQSGLNGKPIPGFADRKDLLPWLHTLCSGLPHPPTAARAAPSPDGVRQLIIAESKRWPWQPCLRIGLLARVAASPALLGRGVWGMADRSGWTLRGFIEPATNGPKASG